MRRLALAAATLVALLLPLTAQSADAHPVDHHQVSQRVIDWD